MHALEKMLARASDQQCVCAGQIVDVEVDWVGINDLYPHVVETFQSLEVPRVWDPARVLVFLDHYAPPPTVKSASNLKLLREFARQQGLNNVFDINAGVCHEVLRETRMVKPGDIVVLTDSHTTTHGAMGAFATGVGATDMAVLLASGRTWMRCPAVVRFRLEGAVLPGVMAKDVVLQILDRVGADGAIYQAIEYTGPAVASLSLDDRMVLCNMAVEMGAKTSFVAPDEITSEAGFYSEDIPTTDSGYQYAKTESFDLSDTVPLVAFPDSVDNVKAVAKAEAVDIDQGFIGSCTGGRLSDLAVAADILRGRHINSNCRLIVTPASRDIMVKAANRGFIEDIVLAGGTVTNPGCGACIGIHQGLLAPGESCISASNRNFPGRMGSSEAHIYLASPATVAASVLGGFIADPRNYL